VVESKSNPPSHAEWVRMRQRTWYGLQPQGVCVTSIAILPNLVSARVVTDLSRVGPARQGIFGADRFHGAGRGRTDGRWLRMARPDLL